MKDVIIKCDKAGFGYENHLAVTDISLEVKQGDYLCIVGENGSGKSTLMKGLLGLLKPLQGTIEAVKDTDNSSIGYLPQQSLAQKDFPATVQEVVLSGCLSKHGLFPFYTANEKELARHNMEKLHILDLEKKCYGELSGGQQQRVLLARALCATHNILVLDEPVTGLDMASAQNFYELIRHLNQNHKVAVIMVSHDISHVLPDATHILHLQKEILFYGTPDDYVKSEIGIKYLGGAANV